MWFELHKHTHFSLFDGFGLIGDVVKRAVELDMPALAVTDHGNTCGLAKLYFTCKDKGIKPILGVEVYFQPKFNKENKTNHLCLFAKNQQGYSNIMRIITEANEENFYYKGIVTFELLEKYNEGVICSSGCLAGFIPQAILNNNKELAVKAIKKFKRIFGEDFYFEIMPIPVDKVGTQEKVNKIMYKLGERYNIGCIPTTDSHYTRAEDFPSYKVMHKIAGTKYDIEQTYKDRYMHSEAEIKERLHNEGFTKSQVRNMLNNMEEIYNKINIELDFSESIPVLGSGDSYEQLKERCKEALKKYLKKRGLMHKKRTYLDRLRTELEVIESHHLSDYFLIVADYVDEAKRRDIYVGPGRGSVCASLIADLLGITDVDPVEIGNDFARFLRLDKKKMPDIDLDFEYGKRDEITEYLLQKNKGNSAQVITFGLNRTKNLCNDLIKVFEVYEDDAVIFRKYISKHVDDNRLVKMMDIDYEAILKEPGMAQINKKYDNIVIHFCKLYGQIKYYGTHAAGVVITNGPIKNYISLVKYKGKLATCYDKFDCEDLGFLKFDILGLKTLNILHDIEELTGERYDYRTAPERTKTAIYEGFRTGKTSGVFQLGSGTAKDILTSIGTDNLQDLIAAISLNRPGPLSLTMHEKYAENKLNPPKDSAWYEYTADTNGTLIYQEHVMQICKGLAGLDYNTADKIFKWRMTEEERNKVCNLFVEGAHKVSGVDKQEAHDLFYSMSSYLFNKGHASGYAVISEWHMYHKLFHPTEFWYASMKYEIDEKKKFEFQAEAAADGVLFFLPHVNYTADYSIRKVEGESVVQQGLTSIKNVGQKAAETIEYERRLNGFYKSYDDFLDRVPKRQVNSRVVECLLEQGALEFNKKTYLKRTIKYNSVLYMKGLRVKNNCTI